MSFQDRPDLTTERVTTSRGRPLAALLAVLALVALFIWKPWAGPGASPTPSPSHIAAVPTRTPAPTATPPATPSPEPTPFVPNVDVGWVQPYVTCGYKTVDHRSVLSSLTLLPPLVVTQPPGIGGEITQVTWRARVETNSEQTLFTAAWDPVSTTRRRPGPDRANTDQQVHSVRISYANGPIGGTLVARVEILVEWLGSDGQLLGTENVVPTTYRYGDAGPILPEGCHTSI